MTATAKKETVIVAEKTNLLNLRFSELEEALRKYAAEHHVPIIFDDGLAFLENIIRVHQPKRILEIGCAIGYSAIRMHQVCGSKITTIERNPEMVALATKNIAQAGMQDDIEIVYKDALEAFDLVSQHRYDLIFIDAAKAQYTKFFDLYAPLLASKGIIVCDNMLFHGLVEDDEHYQQQSRSVRGLIRKLAHFHQVLLENEDYVTSIFEIGDGMSVSVKKN